MVNLPFLDWQVLPTTKQNYTQLHTHKTTNFFFQQLVCLWGSNKHCVFPWIPYQGLGEIVSCQNLSLGAVWALSAFVLHRRAVTMWITWGILHCLTCSIDQFCASVVLLRMRKVKGLSGLCVATKEGFPQLSGYLFWRWRADRSLTRRQLKKYRTSVPPSVLVSSLNAIVISSAGFCCVHIPPPSTWQDILGSLLSYHLVKDMLARIRTDFPIDSIHAAGVQ